MEILVLFLTKKIMNFRFWWRFFEVFEFQFFHQNVSTGVPHDFEYFFQADHHSSCVLDRMYTSIFFGILLRALELVFDEGSLSVLSISFRCQMPKTHTTGGSSSRLLHTTQAPSKCQRALFQARWHATQLKWARNLFSWILFKFLSVPVDYFKLYSVLLSLSHPGESSSTTSSRSTR